MAEEGKVNAMAGVEAATKLREAEEKQKKNAEDEKRRISDSGKGPEDPLVAFLSGVPWTVADKGSLVKEVIEIFRGNGILVRDCLLGVLFSFDILCDRRRNRWL